MALVDVPIFSLMRDLYAASQFVSVALTSSNIRRGVSFEAPKTGTIVAIQVSIGAVTGSAPVRMSLQNLNVTGVPNDSYYGNSTPAVLTPAQNTNPTFTLGTAATTNIGETAACVFEWDSTVGTSIAFSYMQLAGLGGFPVGLTYTSSWAKSTGAVIALVLKYSDGSEYPINAPVNALNLASVSSTASPSERGNLFRLPYTARISGVWWVGQASGNNTFDLSLYDANNAVLAVESYNGNIFQGVGNNQLLFPNPYVLPANAWARIAIKGTNTSSVNTREVTFFSRAVMANFSGSADFYSTSRTGTGAWTDIDTNRNLIVPIINGIDFGSTATGKPRGRLSVRGS